MAQGAQCEVMEGMSWREVATWLGGALLALLQVVGLYQIKRIGALEESKADKADLRDLIAELRADRSALIAEMRADRAAAEESRAAMNDKISEVAQSVARLEGRLGGGEK